MREKLMGCACDVAIQITSTESVECGGVHQVGGEEFGNNTFAQLYPFLLQKYECNGCRKKIYEMEAL